MKYLTLLSLVLFIVACGNMATQESSSGLSPEEEASFLARGKALQQEASTVLQTELAQQISQHGYADAISYCQSRAMYFTDSLGHSCGLRVRRVSTKPRNHLNLATVAERAILKDYALELVADPLAELQPRVFVEGEYVYYCGPIRTQALCLNCHGDPERDISAEVLTRIDDHYLYDRATGYRLNDLRGMWSIRFDR